MIYDHVLGYSVARYHRKAKSWALNPRVMDRAEAVKELRRLSAKGKVCFLVEVTPIHSADTFEKE